MLLEDSLSLNLGSFHARPGNLCCLADVPLLITHLVPVHPPKPSPNFSPRHQTGGWPDAADVTA